MTSPLKGQRSGPLSALSKFVNSYVALRPKGYAAVEQQPVRTRNGKAAYHPGRLYDRFAVGDVDGLSGPIDGARCQACSDTADACHLLFGGNKRDAAAAVKAYAKHL